MGCKKRNERCDANLSILGRARDSCSLTKSAPIVFLGTIESISGGTFHFRVEEGFAGVKGSTIDIAGARDPTRERWQTTRTR